jgi:stringent starvation protein B
MYFVYPAIILLAVHGLRELSRRVIRISYTNIRRILLSALVALPAAGFLSIAVWMVRNHPLQYVYYSIPSKYVEYNFELDYWGLAYRQAYEWLLENDADPYITVTVTSSPGWENLNILTREQRQRLVLSKRYTSKYVLDNFDWQQYRHTLPDDTIVHSITVSGMQVLNIYRNPFWEPQEIDPSDIMENEEVQMRFGNNSLM